MPDTLASFTLTGPGQASHAGNAGLRAPAYIRAILRFEGALAASQAALGAIPAEAARSIERASSDFEPDVAAIAREAYASGTPVIEVLRQFGAHLDAQAPGAREYLHRGATSQDAMDTAMALCTAPLVAAAVSALDRACAASVALTARHATDPMLARTLMQPAGLITFGFKSAQWAAALSRSASRIRDAADRALCLQLAGAVGTGAAFGASWAELQAAAAGRLGLRAGVTWQSMRDEWLNLLVQIGLAAGVAGKIAGDVILLGQAEVAEALEPSSSAGRSSAMPHKRNPVLGLRIRGCWHVTNGVLAGLVPTLAVEQERGLGTWQAELVLAPLLLENAVSAVESLAQLLEGLQFDAARARHNIESTGGLVYSERAVHHLARIMMPGDARLLVDQASTDASRLGIHLRAALTESMKAMVPAVPIEGVLDAVFDTDEAAASSAEAAKRVLDSAGLDTSKVAIKNVERA